MSADAARIFWKATGNAGLNLGTSSQGSDLYRYDVGSGTLTDLTPDGADANGPSVQGVLGASDDLSYIYFAANGVLASGATAPTTPCHTGAGAGSCDLYLLHDGTITFVAGLSQADTAVWDARPARAM